MAKKLLKIGSSVTEIEGIEIGTKEQIEAGIAVEAKPVTVSENEIGGLGVKTAKSIIVGEDVFNIPQGASVEVSEEEPEEGTPEAKAITVDDVTYKLGGGSTEEWVTKTVTVAEEDWFKFKTEGKLVDIINGVTITTEDGLTIQIFGCPAYQVGQGGGIVQSSSMGFYSTMSAEETEGSGVWTNSVQIYPAGPDDLDAAINSLNSDLDFEEDFIINTANLAGNLGAGDVLTVTYRVISADKAIRNSWVV